MTGDKGPDAQNHPGLLEYAESTGIWHQIGHGMVVSGAIILVLALLVVASSLISMPYYSLSPGNALPVSHMLAIPGKSLHPLHGQVLMTDVEVAQVTLLGYIVDHFESHVALVKSDELIGPGPASELNGEAMVEMTEAKLTARVEALRQMGYSVPEQNAGAVIWMVLKPSPSWGKLTPGDIVTAVNGRSISTANELADAISAERPGSTATLTFTTVNQLIGSGGKRSPNPHYSQVKIVIGKRPPTLGGANNTGFIGVVPFTQGVYSLPFAVNLSTGMIGGPSAGLAFTLGILNALNGSDLTGGKIVAATGTIRPNGAVGPVGGVREKTIAVERAGATVFIVPREEYNSAVSVASKHLKVVAVTSLTQALSALHRIGGRLGNAAHGPVSGSGGHSAPPGFQYAPWS